VFWTLNQKKVDLQVMHNWNFRRRHICYAENEFAVLLNDKSLQMEFPKQSLSFLDKNKKWNAQSVLLFLIHKPLAFCTTYLCEATFSKLINHEVQGCSDYTNVTWRLWVFFWISTCSGLRELKELFACDGTRDVFGVGVQL